MSSQGQRGQPRPAAQSSVHSCSARQRRAGQLDPRGRQQCPPPPDETQIGSRSQPVRLPDSAGADPAADHAGSSTRTAARAGRASPGALAAETPPDRARARHRPPAKPGPQGRQVIQQPFDQRPPVQNGRRRYRLHQPGPRTRLAQRLPLTARTVADHARPVHRHPHHPPDQRPWPSTSAAAPSSRCPPGRTHRHPSRAREPLQQRRTRHHRSRHTARLASRHEARSTRRIHDHHHPIAPGSGPIPGDQLEAGSIRARPAKPSTIRSASCRDERNRSQSAGTARNGTA